MPDSLEVPSVTFLQGGGEMGTLMRAKDWMATPLGAPETWSPALKVVVGLMLANRFPQLLWWGPDYISLYNDAYRPVLGTKHPAALGLPFRDVWPEVRDALAPLIDVPFNGGPASWTDDIQLEVRRHGSAEETHFTFAYSPVADDTAPRGIGGVLCTVMEITEQIVGARRLAALRDLGARTGDARSGEDACANMAQALPAYPLDVPFALIYLADDELTRARLAGVAGMAAGDPAAPPIIDLHDPAACWPLGRAAEWQAMVVVEDLGKHFPALQAGPWPDPPHTAVIVPLVTANRLVGFLAAGVSARLRLDEDYRSFFELSGAQIATGIGNAQAYEQERERAEALAAIDRAKTVFFSNISHEFRTPLPAAAGPKASILIAGDNADMRDYLVRLLGYRYDVRHVADGAKALAAIHDRRPDLVLSDSMMPRLDGYGLLNAIRNEPALADLPVVLLSARAGEEATIEGLAAGADDYLTKPFSARELLARLSANLERARGRRDLRESEERFRALVMATSDVVFRMSPDWTELRALYGRGILTDTEAPTVDWTDDYILPEDRPVMRVKVQEAIGNKVVFQMEHRVRRADGTVGWVFSRAIPLLGVSGEIIEWFGAATDISERVAAVGALRNANETLERRVADALAERRLMAELVQTSDTFVQVLDRNFRFLAINDASASEYVHIYGFRPKVGDSLVELMAGRPDLREPVLAIWSRALVGEAFMVSEEFGDPDRRRRYYELTFRPLRDAKGELIGAYQFATDITDRRDAQARLAVAEEQLRQTQKMEAIGQLTGGIAHDFNNLLGGISGSLELLQKRMAQKRFDDVDRFVEAARSASRRAASLTQRLLAFSRRQMLDPKATDLNRIVAGLEELIGRSVGPDVTLNVVTGQDLWLTQVDVPQIENALLNLCVNGRDAMAPDGGRLVIETANRLLNDLAAREFEVPPGQYVSLSVSDSGTGMPPDVIKQAFDPFFTTKPLGQGTGLGLSMVHGFVRQSGGQVRIQSQMGKGTTVSLLLPRFAGDTDVTPVSPPMRTDAAEGETVLVVDDEASVRMVMKEELTDRGYRVLEAEDGPSALRILQSRVRIDLLVSDVGLPGGMNGRQVAEAARSLRPRLKVLLVTGYAQTAEVRDADWERGMDILTKPFVGAALMEKVRDLLGQRTKV